jgi:hypothetical protein
MRLYIFFSFLAFTIQLQGQSAKRMYPIYKAEFDSLIQVQDSLSKTYKSTRRWAEINHYQVADRFTYLERLQKTTSLQLNADHDSLNAVYLFLTGSNYQIRFRRKFSIYGQMDTVRVAIKQQRQVLDSAALSAVSLSEIKLQEGFDDIRKVKEKNQVLVKNIESLKLNNYQLQTVTSRYKNIDAEYAYLKKLNVRLEDSISWWKYRFEKINQENSDSITLLRFNFERNGPNGFSNNYFVVFPDVHKKPEVKQNKKPKKGEVLLRDEELIIPSKTVELMDVNGSSSNNVIYEEPYPVKVDENMVYELVDESAMFPGGLDSMKVFIKNNLVYPLSVKNSTIQGKVYFRLVINKNGEITDAKIYRPIANCPECSEAVKELISKMPKWQPGRVDGKNVNSYFIHYVKFNLD